MSQDQLVERIAHQLQRTRLSIATAESCTVGGVCARLGSLAGASAYLRGGVVAYQTSLKVELLGVPSELIDRYSVVSEQVALVMARGVRERLHADIGVATTGVAGPTGGDNEHPVGTIWLATSRLTPEGELIRTKMLTLRGDRAQNIATAIEGALLLVSELI